VLITITFLGKSPIIEYYANAGQKHIPHFR